MKTFYMKKEGSVIRKENLDYEKSLIIAPQKNYVRIYASFFPPRTQTNLCKINQK